LWVAGTDGTSPVDELSWTLHFLTVSTWPQSYGKDHDQFDCPVVLKLSRVLFWVLSVSVSLVAVLVLRPVRYNDLKVPLLNLVACHQIPR
jgi:hypothetical protein